MHGDRTRDACLTSRRVAATPAPPWEVMSGFEPTALSGRVATHGCRRLRPRAARGTRTHTVRPLMPVPLPNIGLGRRMRGAGGILPGSPDLPPPSGAAKGSTIELHPCVVPVGFEPTASLVLSQSGLPLPTRRCSRPRVDEPRRGLGSGTNPLPAAATPGSHPALRLATTFVAAARQGGRIRTCGTPHSK